MSQYHRLPASRHSTNQPRFSVHPETRQAKLLFAAQDGTELLADRDLMSNQVGVTSYRGGHFEFNFGRYFDPFQCSPVLPQNLSA